MLDLSLDAARRNVARRAAHVRSTGHVLARRIVRTLHHAYDLMAEFERDHGAKCNCEFCAHRDDDDGAPDARYGELAQSDIAGSFFMIDALANSIDCLLGPDPDDDEEPAPDEPTLLPIGR